MQVVKKEFLEENKANDYYKNIHDEYAKIFVDFKGISKQHGQGKKLLQSIEEARLDGY